MRLGLMISFLLVLCYAPSFASAGPTALESRAVRLICRAELERVSDAASNANACSTFDVSRIEASAMALDSMTGLRLSDQMDWRNPLIDHDDVRRVVDQWSKWLERNGSHLSLSQVVVAVEKSMTWLAKQHEVP